jgi:hypothetical protein
MEEERKIKIVQDIEILGERWYISYEKLEDTDIDGYCDYTSRKIVIRKDNYNEVGNFKALQKKQLRHEIIHAFLAESGLQSNFEHHTQWGHEETMIDWIAIQFPKINSVFKRLNILE